MPFRSVDRRFFIGTKIAKRPVGQIDNFYVVQNRRYGDFCDCEVVKRSVGN